MTVEPQIVDTSAAALDCRVVWSEDLKPARSSAGVLIENPFA
jgi:predicted nucleic acid-binding protein